MKPTLALLAVSCAVSGCSGNQSSLAPAGHEAELVAKLFWSMLGGGLVIWATVVGGALFAARRRAKPFGVRVGRAVILGGGIALPLVILTALLVPGLAMIPALARAADGAAAD